MEHKRLRDIKLRLEYLDEQWTHKVRPPSGSLVRPSTEELERRLSDLATYTIGLKELLQEIVDGLEDDDDTRSVGTDP